MKEKLVRIKGVLGEVHFCIAFVQEECLKGCLPPSEATEEMGFGYLETENGPVAVSLDAGTRKWIPASEERLEAGIRFEEEQWIDPTGCSSMICIPWEYMEEFSAIRERTRMYRGVEFVR